LSAVPVHPGGVALPDGIEVLPPDAPRDDWLAARRLGIGGSDIPTLYGEGYHSEYRLWLDKQGFLGDAESHAATRGRWLEPHLADWFADRTGLAVYRVGLVQHRDQPEALVTPDRIAEDGTVCEIKCLDAATPILTTRGWVSMGDLAVGDEVHHPDGHPVRVVEASGLKFGKDCYRVTTSDGRSVVADSEHIWTVQDLYRTQREDLTTVQLIERGLRAGVRWRFRLPHQRALITKPVDLPLDPYLLGAWLGDGTAGTGKLNVGRADLDEMRALIAEAAGCATAEPRWARTGWEVRPQLPSDNRCAQSPNLTRDRIDEARQAIAAGVSLDAAARSVGTPRQTLTRALARQAGDAPPLQPPTFRSRLRELGVLDTKRMPDVYLTAGTEQRLALLQGLLDTDGGISTRGQVTFCSTIEQLADAVLYLARSLGWNATSRRYEREHKPYWLVRFTPTADDPPPFRMARKRERVGGSLRMRRGLHIASIEAVTSRPVRCIRVDSPDGLFLAGRDLVPTHNTFSQWAKVRADWRSGELPRRVWYQGQWQLAVTGLEAAWFVGYEIDQAPILRGPYERDERLIREMRERVANWWDRHVRRAEPPAVDLATLDDDEAALRWPTVLKGAVECAQPHTLLQLLRERHELAAKASAGRKADTARKTLDVQIRALVGDAEGLTVGGRLVVTNKAQDGAAQVSAELEQDHPDIWAGYVTRPRYRVLRPVKGWQDATPEETP
jgi:predicted phage-related endonuclease